MPVVTKDSVVSFLNQSVRRIMNADSEASVSMESVSINAKMLSVNKDTNANTDHATAHSNWTICLDANLILKLNSPQKFTKGTKEDTEITQISHEVIKRTYDCYELLHFQIKF